MNAQIRAMMIATTLAVAAFGCAPVPADDATGTTESAQSEHNWKVLNVQYEVQQTVFWCGPAATRVALSTRKPPPSQAALAWELGTTFNGTDYIGQITNVLNNHLGAGQYETRTLPGATPWERDRFWRDIMYSIDNNYVVVANLVATPNNHPPGYPFDEIYHYFSVIGYNPDTWEVFIADSAFFSGKAFYWIPFNQLVSLVQPKGYSTWVQRGTRCVGGDGMAIGAIEGKFLSLGGCGSFLGAPLTEEMRTPNGRGRYNVFQNGSIYWSQATGAHEVHGYVRDKWRDTGWEAGTLGYPTSDEIAAPDGVGRYSEFERGAIYYTADTGANDVYGQIYAKWTELGREKSALGYPTSTEYGIGGGRQSDFQHGWITWDAATNVATVTMAE